MFLNPARPQRTPASSSASSSSGRRASSSILSFRRRPATTTTMATAAALDLPALAAKPLGAGTPAPSLQGTKATAPVLLTTTSCPYAARTWLALEFSGLNYTPVFVDLKNKAEWHLQWNPYGRVPTLAWASSDGDTAAASMYESLVCNEFINDVTGGKLLPSDPSAAAGARLLIDQFTQKFGAAFGGLLFSEDGSEKANEAAAKVDEALAFLEQNTAAPSADGSIPAPPAGPLFFLGSNGGAFTLVDAALYPFLARLNKVMPRLAPKSAGKFADLASAGYPRVAAWLGALAARPEVKRTEIAPAGSAGFWEALEETYVEYRARQRAAAAAAAAAAAK